MTPDDSAQNRVFIDFEYYSGWYVYIDDGGKLGPYSEKATAQSIERQIVDALRAYGDERARQERERCAWACQELTARRASEMGLAHYDHLTGYQCAAAISALT